MEEVGARSECEVTSDVLESGRGGEEERERERGGRARERWRRSAQDSQVTPGREGSTAFLPSNTRSLLRSPSPGPAAGAPRAGPAPATKPALRTLARAGRARSNGPHRRGGRGAPLRGIQPGLRYVGCPGRRAARGGARERSLLRWRCAPTTGRFAAHPPRSPGPLRAINPVGCNLTSIFFVMNPTRACRVLCLRHVVGFPHLQHRPLPRDFPTR